MQSLLFEVFLMVFFILMKIFALASKLHINLNNIINKRSIRCVYLFSTFTYVGNSIKKTNINLSLKIESLTLLSLKNLRIYYIFFHYVSPCNRNEYAVSKYLLEISQPDQG